LVRAFWGGCLDSPREEEGLMAMAANGSGAYWAPSSPLRSEATHIEGGCSDRSEGSSPTAWKHFDRRLPTKGPVGLGTHAPRLKRAHARGRRGRPSHPLIRLPLTGGRGSSKGPRPLVPHRPTDGVPISLSLSLSSHDRVVLLAAWLIACPGASAEKPAPRVSPRPSPRHCTKS
jgi:hypothetical protein